MIVQMKDGDWDLGYAWDGDEFGCPQCEKRVRGLFSRICGNFRVTMCRRCWKKLLAAL